MEILNKCETTNETQNMNPEKIKCKKCKFKTTSSRNLRMHVNLVHDPKFFNCDQCDIKAKTKVDLKHHKESNHETLIVHCPHCEAKFKEKELLTSRIKHRKIAKLP